MISRATSKRFEEFSEDPNTSFKSKRVRYNTPKVCDSTIESIKKFSNVILSKPMQFRENRITDPRSTPSASKYDKRTEEEVKLLTKFDTEVLTSSEAMNTLSSLRVETQEKYLYQIRRYIRRCANKGLENFYVTKEMAKELIQHELSIRGKISENTIKSIRSPLNKLYLMNRIVYRDSQVKDPLCDLMEDLAGNNHLNGVNECCERGYGIEILPFDTTNGVIKFSDPTKKTLTESEAALLKKYDREILNSEKTTSLLQNLAGSTFKAYSVDIKRFVKFCGRKCLNNFLLNQDILQEFLRSELENKTNALTKFKSLRRSLLKLNQLNCLAYDLSYSDEELINLLNTILSQVKDTAKEEWDSEKCDISENCDISGKCDVPGKCDIITTEIVHEAESIIPSEFLVDTFNRVFKSSSSLDHLSNRSKRLHYAEMRRFVIFCSHEQRTNFTLEGNFLKTYLTTSILPKFPEISRTKIREIVSRLVKLHEMSGKSEIPNFDIVDTFISQYQPRSKMIMNLKGKDRNSPPQRDVQMKKEPSLEDCCLNITFKEESLLKNCSLTKAHDTEHCLQLKTVSQLVKCFISVQEELKAPPKNTNYNDLKSVILLVEELIYEGFTINGNSPREEICQILDDYISQNKLTLQDLAIKAHKFPTYTRREFQRIMTRRKIFD
jgi:hypothetical protein